MRKGKETLEMLIKGRSGWKKRAKLSKAIIPTSCTLTGDKCGDDP